jgi:metal transporter CNNM
MTTLAWIGIAFCLLQSAFFSGLNLAFFDLTRLQLEVEALSGNPRAEKVLRLRDDAHFLLATILWGNVGINVMLTLLSNSVLAGVSAFFFSTIVITFLGEIVPQAYFSRHALRMASLLAPFIRFYRIVLYPVAKPSALMLDWWLGKEGIRYFRERDLRAVIRKHIDAPESDVDRLEGVGALNFLAIDDLLVSQEGEPVDPKSVISLPTEGGLPRFPALEHAPSDPFLRRVYASGKKWVIITDPSEEPIFALDADAFLRAALFEERDVNPYAFCHRPIIVRDPRILLGNVISRLKVLPQSSEDDVIDQDIVLVWGPVKRVITGSDILGRLLRGIAIRDTRVSPK